jgi:hypothetical protein
MVMALCRGGARIFRLGGHGLTEMVWDVMAMAD